MHGRDLSPILENPEADSDHAVLLIYTDRAYGSDTNELPADVYGSNGIPWWVSYRKNAFKYIMSLAPGEIDELYNIDADPDELVNLANYPDYQPILFQYNREMIAELKRTDAPFVDQIH